MRMLSLRGALGMEFWSFSIVLGSIGSVGDKLFFFRKESTSFWMAVHRL